MTPPKVLHRGSTGSCRWATHPKGLSASIEGTYATGPPRPQRGALHSEGLALQGDSGPRRSVPGAVVRRNHGRRGHETAPGGSVVPPGAFITSVEGMSSLHEGVHARTDLEPLYPGFKRGLGGRRGARGAGAPLTSQPCGAPNIRPVPRRPLTKPDKRPGRLRPHSRIVRMHSTLVMWSRDPRD